MRIMSDGFHRLALIFLLCTFPIILFAQQELPNQVLPSPTAMQLQKYGDYPVSYYTGIPNIKVPIYTIKEGDIEVPIYLSFHASGMNMNEQQGILGYGWTLNTGGLISRTIHGYPDEYYDLYIPNLETLYPSSNPYPYLNSYGYFQDLSNDQNHEYDTYSYNFLGHSGKYIPQFFRQDDLEGDYGWSFLMKADNVRIYPDNRIVDDKGINYYFGEGEHQVFNQPSYPTAPFTAVSSWYLGLITSNLHPGMGVSYEYQTGPFYTNNKATRVYKIDDFIDLDRATHQSVEEFQEIMNNYFTYNKYGTNDHFQDLVPSSRNYYTLAPKKISFSEGYMLFHLSTSKQHLQYIEIYNRKNELLKRVDFALTYIDPYYSQLKSVIFKDGDGQNQETYSFEYYPGSVDHIHSGKDHWGFYNGSYLSSGDHFISYSYPYFNVFNAGTVNFGETGYTREPNTASTKTFMLKKITYPTGGYTTFDYEGNQLGYIDQWNPGPLKQVGGLRVKEINSYGHDDQLLGSKQYAYKSKGFTESGIENDPKKFYVQHAVVEAQYNSSVFARRATFFENIPLDLFPKGAPIGYYEVTETEGATKTTYTFDDEDAYDYKEVTEPGVSTYGPEGGFNFKKMAHGYKPWNFGNLIDKVTLAPGLNRTEYYTYETSVTDTVQDLNIYQAVFTGLGGESSEHRFKNDFNFAKQYYYSGFKRLKEKFVSEQGTDSIPISTTEKYSYANAHYPLQISSKSEIDSRGDTIKTDYKYANNYMGTPIYADMELRNMTSEALEVTETNLSQSKELKKVKRDYAYFRPSPTDSVMIQLQSIRSSVGGAALDTLVKVERYDNKGRILQYRGRDQQVASYLYIYGNFYPTAHILGTKYNELVAAINPVYFTSPVIESNIPNNLVNRFKLYLPQTQFSIYTYIPGVGVKTQTDTRGRTTYYEYDSFQRLKLIRDHEGKIVKQYNYHLKPSTP